MKYLYRCVAALTLGTLSISFIGCDSATDAAKGVAAQLQEEFEKGTVLLRAKGQLADAQKGRAELKKIADQFHVDSGVALRQITRLEETKNGTVEAFTKLQEAARSAELPKLADATPEDKAKTIQIGTRTLTGADVYRILQEYRTEVEKAAAAIERERKQSAFLKERAEKIREQISRADANIAEMERKIADYEMYQRLLKAKQTIEYLGLSDDKMKELCIICIF